MKTEDYLEDVDSTGDSPKLTNEINVNKGAEKNSEDINNEVLLSVKQPTGLSPSNNPDRLIELAINKDLDIDKLKQLLQMKKEWDAEQARIAFNEAMMQFQAECPIIKKTRVVKNKEGIKLYAFAPIESIVSQLNGLLSKFGFSYRIETEFPSDKIVRAKCIVEHSLGHTKESYVDMPYLSQTNLMSDAQVVAGTVTFAKRYAFCNALGIMTSDEDNDGISQTKKDEFNNLIKDWKSNETIKKVADSIEYASAFNDFLSKLPQSSDIDRLNKAIEKMPEDKQLEIWKRFEASAYKMTWKNFLDQVGKL